MTESANQSEILLEAGTNEFEVLAFRLHDAWYGVNVAKVREVIRWVRPHESPHQHPSVLGMFNLRGQVLGVVDLKKHLGLGETDPNDPSTRIIVTEFNGIRSGFAVDDVEQIHRISWKQVRPAPTLDGLDGEQAQSVSSCTGIVELQERLILMLDFESIADAILFEEKLHVESVENSMSVDRAAKRVLLVEDSPFMRELIRRIFKESGYDRAEVLENGQAAWDRLSELYREGGPADVDAIVSDIEMPQIDGLNLCRRIRGTAGPMSQLPVVLFSSLISEDNKKKGEQVGANAQVPKPDLAGMVRLVDRLVEGKPIIEQAAA